MRNLMVVLNSARSDPSPVQSLCERVFYYISIGYVPILDKMQIACFDYNGRCRMCIRYQIDLRGDWNYEVVNGFKYQRIEEELWEN